MSKCNVFQRNTILFRKNANVLQEKTMFWRGNIIVLFLFCQKNGLTQIETSQVFFPFHFFFNHHVTKGFVQNIVSTREFYTSSKLHALRAAYATVVSCLSLVSASHYFFINLQVMKFIVPMWVLSFTCP